MNILQIAGGEGAGRTILAVRLAEEWSGVATILTLERYLRNKRPDDSADFSLQPTSVDWPLLYAHIEALARGERVRMPEYDLVEGQRLPSRLPQTKEFGLPPIDILIIDGLHYLEEVESIKLFVDTPANLRRERIQQRNTEMDQRIAEAFDTLYEPAYQRYTLPIREEADLVLDGCRPLEELVTQTQRFIASVWGAWG